MTAQSFVRRTTFSAAYFTFSGNQHLPIAWPQRNRLVPQSETVA